MVESLLSMGKVLGSVPSPLRREKERGEEEEARKRKRKEKKKLPARPTNKYHTDKIIRFQKKSFVSGTPPLLTVKIS